MAQKTKKTEEFISLSAEALGVVSYADYFTQTPLFTSLQIKNAGADAATDLTLTVSNENGLVVSCIKPIAEVPFESSVEVDLGNVLSPHYFVGACYQSRTGAIDTPYHHPPLGAAKCLLR